MTEQTWRANTEAQVEAAKATAEQGSGGKGGGPVSAEGSGQISGGKGDGQTPPA